MVHQRELILAVLMVLSLAALTTPSSQTEKLNPLPGFQNFVKVPIKNKLVLNQIQPQLHIRPSTKHDSPNGTAIDVLDMRSITKDHPPKQDIAKRGITALQPYVSTTTTASPWRGFNSDPSSSQNPFRSDRDIQRRDDAHHYYQNPAYYPSNLLSDTAKHDGYSQTGESNTMLEPYEAMKYQSSTSSDSSPWEHQSSVHLEHPVSSLYDIAHQYPASYGQPHPNHRQLYGLPYSLYSSEMGLDRIMTYDDDSSDLRAENHYHNQRRTIYPNQIVYAVPYNFKDSTETNHAVHVMDHQEKAKDSSLDIPDRIRTKLHNYKVWHESMYEPTRQKVYDAVAFLEMMDLLRNLYNHKKELYNKLESSNNFSIDKDNNDNNNANMKQKLFAKLKEFFAKKQKNPTTTPQPTTPPTSTTTTSATTTTIATPSPLMIMGEHNTKPGEQQMRFFAGPPLNFPTSEPLSSAESRYRFPRVYYI